MHNSENILNEEISRIAVAGVILGANIAVMIFLFSESNFLISNSDIHNYIYGFVRYGLLIDSIFLYVYIASVGVLSVHHPKTGLFRYSGPARACYKLFFRLGVEFSFYIFTFSVASYIGAILFI